MPQRLNRAELYEAVWSTPMTTLAPRFGISDVALKKTAQNWTSRSLSGAIGARRQAGKPTNRVALPPRGAGMHDEVVVGGRNRCWYGQLTEEEILGPLPQSPSFLEDLTRVRDRVGNVIGKVGVPKAMTAPHPAIARPIALDDARRIAFTAEQFCRAEQVTKMSEIEDLVLGELGKAPEMSPIERGFAWERGEDVTCLWFKPTTVPPDEFRLCATAVVETVFRGSLPTLPDPELARLNRRACFGSFFTENGRLGIRATYCIYEKEPAARWVAVALLRAMGEQLALGYGIAQSEWVPDSFAGNRANLEYGRRWVEPPDPQEFDLIASQFRDRGLVSTRAPHGLVLEFPLDGGSPSRMFDPRAETALLHVSTDVPHPLAGVGYAATIALPFDPASADIPSWCRLLNDAESAMQDFVPRLGAWGMRSLDRELVYSLFWPTDHSATWLPGTIMNWLVKRTMWLQKRYWEPGVGLVRPGGPHA